MADRLNLQRFFFTFNLITTAVVFFLLAPTTYIYQSWFPDKTDSLWIFPVSVVGFSAFCWFFASLSIPRLIRWGWIKDLRQSSREKEMGRFERFLRIVSPILVTSFHLSLMIAFSIMLIAFLRENSLEKIFVNLP